MYTVTYVDACCLQGMQTVTDAGLAAVTRCQRLRQVLTHAQAFNLVLLAVCCQVHAVPNAHQPRHCGRITTGISKNALQRLMVPCFMIAAVRD